MKVPILKAVAMPPRLFWAPFIPAVANLSIQFPMMFIMMALFDANPLVFIGTIIPVHLLIVIFGVREPHMSNMMKAWGPLSAASHNVYKDKGKKLAP
jgi:ABC-type transport system involved in cytochrome bd biosynthesis fused ATPase/permease subunit